MRDEPSRDDVQTGAISFRRSLALTVAAMDLPFGYTLTIWSSGALAVAHYGVPRVGEILAFLLGGLAAYLAATWIAVAHFGTVTPARIRRSSSLNVFSILAAIVVSGLTGAIQTPLVGYFIAGFSGTAIYLLGISTFNWLLARSDQMRGREDSRER